MAALLAFAFALGGARSSAAQSARPGERAGLPNVVIIVADDLGWADVGYHSGEVSTPNIDRLASQGIRLERFYAASVCSPTRAGLMSGRYPDRFGMRHGVVEPTKVHGLPPSEQTIAEVLAGAGYTRRAAMGKWHLGHSSTKYHPLNQGFTQFYGHYNGAVDYFTHKRDGELDWHRDFASSYDEGYSTDLLAKEAVRFIEESPRERPFLLYLAFNAVHSPMQAKREDLDRHGFDPAKGTFTEGTGGQQKGERDVEHYGKIGNGNSIRQTYLGMLDGLDEGVGRVLDALDRRGIAENTLVLFMSDNGGMPRFGGNNKPLRGNKHTSWEGGVRVDAIVRWPARLRGGRTVDDVLAYVDVVPTLRRIVGASGPPPNPLDGIDMLEVLEGKSSDPDRSVYLGDDAVVTHDWKLIDDQLFAIASDPNETTDVASRHPAVVARLRQEIARYRKIEGPPTETGRFTTPPEWKIPEPAQPPRPNIVLIMADDMGFSDIGPYGGEIRTPNLDRLASQGIRFSQFYNTARCSPTRASLLTGLYPHQAGMGHMPDGYAARARKIFNSPAYSDHLTPTAPTMAEVLGAAGYDTYMTGKWHLGYRPEEWPAARGFDHSFTLIAGASNYFGYGVQGGGRIGFAPMAVDDQRYTPPREGFLTTDAFADHAAAYIREHEGPEPFFLYLAFNAPHWPLQAPAEDIARYRGEYLKKGWDAVRRERYDRLVGLGLIDPSWALAPRPEDVPAWQDTPEAERQRWDAEMSIYAAQVERMDAGIGRVLEALRQKGIEDNTLVIFLSDNGGAAEDPNRSLPGAVPGSRDSYEGYGIRGAHVSSAPFRRTKKWVHEGGIATPLIVRWPAADLETGAIRRQPAELIDLMPTLLAVSGAAFPKHFRGVLTLPPEGVSLLPEFRGEPLPERAIIWEHEGNRAVREGKWKLVRQYPLAWELYDMEADRTELHDLAAAQPERVRRMAAEYEAWAARVGAQPWRLTDPRATSN